MPGVKPASFDYIRPGGVNEVVALLAEHGERARVLAGGQSLMLELNYRRLRPELLVDINAVGGLDVLEQTGDVLRIGALVRHARFERAGTNAPLERLLARVSRFVAHPPIRSRGTMVGSLAYAHPAAEWPAVAVALDASLTLVSAAGTRTLPAASFYLGPFATACRADELLTEVALPVLPRGARVGFFEYRRTQASFAVVAAVAVLELEDGGVRTARVGLAGAADRPLRAHQAERVLLAGGSFAAAAAAAATEARPVGEPHCSSEYRRHVIGVAVRRALEEAAADPEAM
jgi:aerobic carbon-monoxide dehydrogenase medium subunit